MFSFPQILPDPTSLTTQLYISVGWFLFWDRRKKEGKREGEFFLVGGSYESLQVWGWFSSFVWHPTFSSLLSAIFYDLPPFLSHTPSGHKVPGDLSSTWNLPSSFLTIAGAHSVCYSCFYLSTGRWVWYFWWSHSPWVFSTEHFKDFSPDCTSYWERNQTMQYRVSLTGILFSELHKPEN